MVKSVVKHIFDCFFSFSEPPEIRTVEGFSAVFAFVRCEHRLCSQTSRATNCATPRYAIKLWSCKWSNLWSNTFLTAFYHFPNRPKSAPLKGFRRFFFSGTEWEIYAPKCGALSTALHPDKIFIFLKMQYRNKFVVKVEKLSSMRFIRYCLYYSKIGGKCQLRKGNNVDLIQFTYKYRIYLFVI